LPILRAGTNLIAFFGKNNVPVPATLKALAPICGKSFTVFRTQFQELVTDGLIMRLSSGRVIRYYMNPNFAVAGDKLPTFLFELFDINSTQMLGEHLFSADNQISRDNRNKDSRFGNLKNLRTTVAIEEL